MLIGGILLPLSWFRLVDADYQFANFHMAASHFNMGIFVIISYFKFTEINLDNLIIVDGNYRYIPSKVCNLKIFGFIGFSKKFLRCVPLSMRKVSLTMLAPLSTTGPPPTARDSKIPNRNLFLTLSRSKTLALNYLLLVIYYHPNYTATTILVCWSCSNKPVTFEIVF